MPTITHFYVNENYKSTRGFQVILYEIATNNYFHTPNLPLNFFLGNYTKHKMPEPRAKANRGELK